MQCKMMKRQYHIFGKQPMLYCKFCTDGKIMSKVRE